jgi:hypothetical protein
VHDILVDVDCSYAVEPARVHVVDCGVGTGVQERSDHHLPSAWFAGMRQVDVGEQDLPRPDETVADRRTRQAHRQRLVPVDQEILLANEPWQARIGDTEPWHLSNLKARTSTLNRTGGNCGGAGPAVVAVDRLEHGQLPRLEPAQTAMIKGGSGHGRLAWLEPAQMAMIMAGGAVAPQGEVASG